MFRQCFSICVVSVGLTISAEASENHERNLNWWDIAKETATSGGSNIKDTITDKVDDTKNNITNTVTDTVTDKTSGIIDQKDDIQKQIENGTALAKDQVEFFKGKIEEAYIAYERIIAIFGDIKARVLHAKDSVMGFEQNLKKAYENEKGNILAVWIGSAILSFILTTAAFLTWMLHLDKMDKKRIEVLEQIYGK